MSEIISVVNLNMLHQVPVWKQEKFYYWGLTGMKNLYFFGPKSKKCCLQWDIPTCTWHLGECSQVTNLQTIELPWFIQFLLHFQWFGIPQLWEWGWLWVCLRGRGSCGCIWGVGWVCLGVPSTCVHIHMLTCMCAYVCNAKNYKLRNCKWLPLWSHVYHA